LGAAKTPTIKPARFPWHEIVIAILLIGAVIAGVVMFRMIGSARKSVDTAVARDSGRAGGASPSVAEKTIAVLPFENLSDNKENAFFTDGVQDEILTNLAKIADLKVISRTSVMQYRGGVQRNLREIGTALGVSHILEGTVQRIGDKIRVNVQLIDARTDAHEWAEGFQRKIADLFALENELSEQIVAQLKLHLSPKEKSAIEQTPTSDLAAYESYTRAKILIERAVFNEPKRESLFEAVRFLTEAVRRDPSFALAYYQLAHAHDQIYWNGYDHTPERIAMADAAIDALRRLRPDAGETHLARAKHFYWVFLDYDRAREQLAAAAQLLPNDPWPWLLTGYIDRRQDRWDESLKKMHHAFELDPRNAFLLQQLSLTYQCLRRYPDVAAILDRALALAPKDARIRMQRALVEFDWHADLKPWRETITAILAEDPAAAAAMPDMQYNLALFQRDNDAAGRIIASLAPDRFYGTEAVEFPRSWWEGVVARAKGDKNAARAAFTSARAVVETMAKQEPENGSILCSLAMIDAALDRKKDAVHEGRRAVELVPVTKDAIDGTMFMQFLAATYAWCGKKDAALDQLAATLSRPGYLSYGQLKLDPLWDPLRNDARFEKIVAGLAPK
jgi:serine/threonine-protein kinase